MGIYGALSTAVTGLRAQSHALENISGNIANSQTVGYKRIETSFKDLIADAPVKSQVPGAVLAQSQATNTIQGDIQTSSNETYIALNGNGFFVVEPKIGQSDGNPLFAGTNFFTRRGDFEIDKDGLLVNGAGYYLKGLPIDTATGNISGSVPEVIKLSNAYLPANVTRQINYQANLPQVPKTANYNAATANSELMKSWSYGGVGGNPAPNYPRTVAGAQLSQFGTQVPARVTSGGVTYVGSAASNTVLNDRDVLTVTANGVTRNLRFNTVGATDPMVSLNAAQSRAGAATSEMVISFAPANLVDIHTAGSLTIGGTAIPFGAPGGATAGDLEDAVEAALGAGTTASYNAGVLTVTYQTANWAPTSYTATAAGSGATLTFDAAHPGFVDGKGVTALNIAAADIPALMRGGNISITPGGAPGTALEVSFAGFPQTPQGLQDAVAAAYANAVPPTTVDTSYANGVLTITHPAGARLVDAAASSNEISIDATGTIENTLASVQSLLRTAVGDAGLIAQLRHGQMVFSAGQANTQDVVLTSTRATAGAVTGDIMGLGDGTYTNVDANDMTSANTIGSMAVGQGNSMTIQIGGVTRNYTFDAVGSVAASTDKVIINSNQSLDAMLADIQADLRLNGGPGAADARVVFEGGRVSVSFPGNYLYDVDISGAAAISLGVNGPLTASTGNVTHVSADDSAKFISESVSGGAITVYASNGAQAKVQLRWAKVDSAATGGEDKWQLFYLSDSTATGNATAWTNVGQDYVFNASGSLVAPGVTEATISNLTVNGVAIGDVKLRHQENGVSQFADVNGTVSVSKLDQNGYGAGEFLSVAISDEGRVVATYSNGERLDMAQVATAQFNGINMLKRLDGGVFQATAESGEPIIDLSGGGIIGGALEASNTDISDEFTKLIITQQAYSAGTRIVSAADEMLQEVLNMIR